MWVDVDVPCKWMPSENRDLLTGQTTGGKRPGSKKYGRAALRDGLSEEECQDRNLEESVLVDESGISYKKQHLAGNPDPGKRVNNLQNVCI
ncbi:hypothetical protein DPMN_138589 [Dreissena polymorpha]|uniref:Uncharacterized protein n=1 Tax=Dreissena polymorpha TaxID=45954 RepID=A0A9D4JFS0_DREPO|nr:hypothetical protein DPMN_138589 [Dreissena polymorpha]